jgi:Uncharacterized conserved protein
VIPLTTKKLVPTGRLFTSNPAGLHKLTVPADVLLITRAGYPVPDTTQVRELSPSPSLFQSYLNTWRDKPPIEWWHKYEERFQIELLSNEKKKALRDVYRQLLNGQNVVLVCFCKDHRYCHRRLVGEFFEPFGVKAEELNPVKVEQISLF